MSGTIGSATEHNLERARGLSGRSRSLSKIAQRGKGSGDTPIPEGAEALGRIGGMVLTVAIAESGGPFTSAALSVVS